MDNVVLFPNIKKDSPPQNMEELIEKVEETRREHVEYIVEDMLPGMFSYLSSEGFDLDMEEYEQTTAFFVESFKAALLKCCGIEHSFHAMAEANTIVCNPVFVDEEKTEEIGQEA